MAKRNKTLDFNRRGKAIVLDSYMMRSNNYMSLSKESKILILLMQDHWRQHKYVDYGIREACEKTPCAKKTAIKAFKELQKKGFIELMEESLFSSRTGSKSRTWKLLWMPYGDSSPVNAWDKDKPVSLIDKVKKHHQSMQQSPSNTF